MKPQYIFTIALIILDIGAAIVYGVQKDIRMTIYWILAAGLNAVVTF